MFALVLARSFHFLQIPILYEPDPMIERSFCLRRKKQWLEKQKRKPRETSPKMDGEEGDQRRILWDFIASRVQGITSSIACPNVEAYNFELKLALISIVQ